MTNLKTTKRALFSSVIALLLCFTMLLGTTFAWFTDSATNSGNKIMSGTLKVDMELLDVNVHTQDQGELVLINRNARLKYVQIYIMIK